MAAKRQAGGGQVLVHVPTLIAGVRAFSSMHSCGASYAPKVLTAHGRQSSPPTGVNRRCVSCVHSEARMIVVVAPGGTAVGRCDLDAGGLDVGVEGQRNGRR
jgi:hypothetical protein